MAIIEFKNEDLEPMPIESNEIENRKRNEALRRAEERDAEIARKRENMRGIEDELEQVRNKPSQSWLSGRGSRGNSTSGNVPVNTSEVVGVVAAVAAFWGSLEVFEFTEWWYALFPAALAGFVAWKFWKPLVAIVLLAIAGAVAYGVLGSPQ